MNCLLVVEQRYVEICSMAGSVGMLVYIDFASQVKRRAASGRVSGVRSCLKARESRKYDGWDEVVDIV